MATASKRVTAAAGKRKHESQNDWCYLKHLLTAVNEDCGQLAHLFNLFNTTTGAPASVAATGAASAASTPATILPDSETKKLAIIYAMSFHLMKLGEVTTYFINSQGLQADGANLCSIHIRAITDFNEALFTRFRGFRNRMFHNPPNDTELQSQVLDLFAHRETIRQFCFNLVDTLSTSLGTRRDDAIGNIRLYRPIPQWEDRSGLASGDDETAKRRRNITKIGEIYAQLSLSQARIKWLYENDYLSDILVRRSGWFGTALASAYLSYYQAVIDLRKVNNSLDIDLAGYIDFEYDGEERKIGYNLDKIGSLRRQAAHYLAEWDNS